MANRKDTFSVFYDRDINQTIHLVSGAYNKAVGKLSHLICCGSPVAQPNGVKDSKTHTEPT